MHGAEALGRKQTYTHREKLDKLVKPLLDAYTQAKSVGENTHQDIYFRKPVLKTSKVEYADYSNCLMKPGKKYSFKDLKLESL